MPFAIDGNWIDIVSAITGIVYAIIQKRRKGLARWTDIGPYIGNGVGLFPVLILALSVVSSQLLQSLLGASRITLFIAGAFALLAMLDDKRPNVD